MRRHKQGSGGTASGMLQEGVRPGDSVEIQHRGSWVPARVTGIGESAVLVRFKRSAEFAFAGNWRRATPAEPGPGA